VVAGSFAVADIVLIKALGIGIAIAVALDATLVRALLVPATMRLLGRWNWWLPAWLERVVAGRLPAPEADIEADADGAIEADASRDDSVPPRRELEPEAGG
jgi:RND superfamily putative drug exporter